MFRQLLQLTGHYPPSLILPPAGDNDIVIPVKAGNILSEANPSFQNDTNSFLL
ncbi:MAG: hypothetical protein ABSG15_02930 [FCB group bacterium]